MKEWFDKKYHRENIHKSKDFRFKEKPKQKKRKTNEITN